MVILSPVVQQPSSGIEDRLQAIQKTLRHADQQTVTATDFQCERQRFDATFHSFSSFIQIISIAPLSVRYYSEVLLTQP